MRCSSAVRWSQRDEGASIKNYQVPVAWGDPGLGKSDVAEVLADDLGWEVYADLATRDPADVPPEPARLGFAMLLFILGVALARGTASHARYVGLC